MFNKQLWSELVKLKSVDRFPVLPCPYCRKPSLQLSPSDLEFRDVPSYDCASLHDKLGSVSSRDVKESFEANKFWGVLLGAAKVLELAQSRWAKFAGFLTCEACGKSVSAVGLAARSRTGQGSAEQLSIKVEYFSPAVPLFELSSTTPESINTELLKAFSYFHSDLTASGAKLRRAAEQFCIELGYKTGSLHKRIEDMGNSFPKEASWLKSLKLLGNEATHADGVEEADLLHAFEVFEVLLHVFKTREADARASNAVAQIEAKFGKQNG